MSNNSIEKFLTVRTKINSYLILVIYSLLTGGYVLLYSPEIGFKNSLLKFFIIMSAIFALFSWLYFKNGNRPFRRTILTETVLLTLVSLLMYYSKYRFLVLLAGIAWLYFLYAAHQEIKLSFKKFFSKIIYASSIVVLQFSVGSMYLSLIGVSFELQTSHSAGSGLIALILYVPVILISIFFHFTASIFLRREGDYGPPILNIMNKKK